MMTKQSISRVLAACLLGSALTMACGDDDDVGGTGDMTGSTGRDGGTGPGVSDAGLDGSTDSGSRDGSARADAAVRLSEPEIVGVTTAANNAEIQAGTLAQSKATGPVREFAVMMISMHTAAQQRQSALGIAPTTSSVRSALETEAAAAQQVLTATPAGVAFDLAYIQSQVTMHRQVRDAMEDILLPNAQTPALRAELATSLDEVTTHLEQAEDLKDELEEDGPIGSDGGV